MAISEFLRNQSRWFFIKSTSVTGIYMFITEKLKKELPLQLSPVVFFREKTYPERGRISFPPICGRWQAGKFHWGKRPGKFRCGSLPGSKRQGSYQPGADEEIY